MGVEFVAFRGIEVCVLPEFARGSCVPRHETPFVAVEIKTVNEFCDRHELLAFHGVLRLRDVTVKTETVCVAHVKFLAVQQIVYIREPHGDAL